MTIHTARSILTKSIIIKSIVLLLAMGENAHAQTCKKPQSHYKNIICTSSSEHFVALKDSGEPAAVLNKSGKRLFSLFEYQKVLPSQFKSGLLPVQKNGKVGYVNTKGKLVIPAIYQSVSTSGKNWARPASNNRIIVKKNGGYGIITTANKIIMPFSTSVTRLDNFSQGKSQMTYNGEDFWLDVFGRKISVHNSMQRKPASIKTAQNNKTNNVASITKKSNVKHNAKARVIGASEITLTPKQIEDLLRKDKAANKTVLSKKQIQHVIDENVLGETKAMVDNLSIATSTSALTAQTVSADLMKKPQTLKSTFIPHQVSGKWGFVDEKEVNMITYSFDEVANFSEGLAGVKINNKWGFINLAGQLVVDFSFPETGVLRNSQTYHGNQPFTFVEGKAWVANLHDKSKICINVRGHFTACS